MRRFRIARIVVDEMTKPFRELLESERQNPSARGSGHSISEHLLKQGTTLRSTRWPRDTCDEEGDSRTIYKEGCTTVVRASGGAGKAGCCENGFFRKPNRNTDVMLSVLAGQLTKTARELVSKDKYRYTLHGYNLDLTYITDRIIAMGYPGDGIRSIYRNDVSEVASFFKEFHYDHYRIINISEIPYNDTTKQILGIDSTEYMGWPDHHPCSLRRMIELMITIDRWLALHPKNIIAVHCQAGRSRTGMILSSYLLYCGKHNDPDEAMAYFGRCRSITSDGVSSPAQRRYVHYLGSLVAQIKHSIPSPIGKRHDLMQSINIPIGGVYPTFRFRKIVLKPVPNISNVKLELYNVKYNPYQLIQLSAPDSSIGPDSIEIVCPFSAKVDGDWMLRVNEGSSVVCRALYNTMFMAHDRIEDGMKVMRITMSDLDNEKAGALKSSRFPLHFCIEIYYNDEEPSPAPQRHQNLAQYPSSQCLNYSVPLVPPQNANGRKPYALTPQASFYNQPMPSAPMLPSSSTSAPNLHAKYPEPVNPLYASVSLPPNYNAPQNTAISMYPKLDNPYATNGPNSNFPPNQQAAPPLPPRRSSFYSPDRMSWQQNDMSRPMSQSYSAFPPPTQAQYPAVPPQFSTENVTAPQQEDYYMPPPLMMSTGHDWRLPGLAPPTSYPQTSSNPYSQPSHTSYPQTPSAPYSQTPPSSYSQPSPTSYPQTPPSSYSQPPPFHPSTQQVEHRSRPVSERPLVRRYSDADRRPTSERRYNSQPPAAYQPTADNNAEDLIQRIVVVKLENNVDENQMLQYFSVCGDVTSHNSDGHLLLILFANRKAAGMAAYLNGGVVGGCITSVTSVEDFLQRSPEEATTVFRLASSIMVKAVSQPDEWCDWE
ncbi:phosphatase tensin type domain-containing protein [Planoprotostelium fungivorum]|uniref:Phosphatase tensin type domain-containing protein n=1 Tax=Planoprotostelium fungivorum TaxID=1890364 RepID=A0A2P6NR01_9EUKA|nr:phosphatase tensin type domain-containing protein [Planoprotostelium fungivorum]